MSSWAFLFPGQGAQSVGMGSGLYRECERARALFDRAREVLGYDMAGICFDGPKEQLDATRYSQPALFVTSLAALEQLKETHPERLTECRFAAGLSLGEYTACAFAGVFDFETGLRIVQERGEAMQAAADARPSGMASVLGLAAEQVEALCDQVRQEGEILAVANYLCPGNIVVSGDRAACERIVEPALEAGAMKVVPLAVAGAFHTPIMESAVGRLRTVLESAELRPARIPVVSNVDAQPHTNPEEIRQLLIRQVCAPVQWEPSMRWLLDQGVAHFCEVGPGRVLRGLLKRIHRKADSYGTLD